MSTSQQKYELALETMNKTKELRRETMRTYIMCSPKSNLEMALMLYQITYTELIGIPDFNDRLTTYKLLITEGILSYLLNRLNKRAQEIDYEHIIKELERSFWNSENWKSNPEEFVNLIPEKSYSTLREVKQDFLRHKELSAYKYMVKSLFH